MKFILTSIFLLFQMGSWAQVPNYIIDDTFDSGGFYTQGGINALLVNENGQILVSGFFNGPNSEAGGYSLISENGNNVFANTSSDYGMPNNFEYLDGYLTCGFNYIYLLNGDELNGNYSFKMEYQKSAYNGFLDNNVLDAIVEPDNSILVGGRFFTDSVNHNNVESLRQLCRIDSTGAPDPDFLMLNCADPIDAQIYRMDTLSDGSLIVSGTFHEFGGYPYNLVGKLNPNFSVDTTFVNSFGPGDTAFLEYIDSQDRIYLSLTGASLLEADNDSIRFVRLLPNGEVDPDFHIPILFDNDVPGGFMSTVVDVLELPDGRFLFTGGFDLVDGLPSKGLIMVEDDGTVIQESSFTNWGADAATWGNFSNLPGASVLRLLDDGKILLGGSFSSFGGEPYNCLVRLQPSGFVGVDEKPERNTLSIYPNPASESIRIRLPDTNQHLTRVVFYDISGRLVQEVSGASLNGEIKLSNFPAGMYVVKGITGTGTFCGKVVIHQK